MNNGESMGKKKWSISKEKAALSANLETMKPSDDGYNATLDAIEKCSRIQNSKMETVANVVKCVGTIAICALIGVAGYSVDRSSEIPQNKLTKELFHKFFRP